MKLAFSLSGYIFRRSLCQGEGPPLPLPFSFFEAARCAVFFFKLYRIFSLDILFPGSSFSATTPPLPGSGVMDLSCEIFGFFFSVRFFGRKSEDPLSLVVRQIFFARGKCFS